MIKKTTNINNINNNKKRDLKENKNWNTHRQEMKCLRPFEIKQYILIKHDGMVWELVSKYF